MKSLIDKKWDCGGASGANGNWWVWIVASAEGGGSPEDPPEYPDTRLFEAPEMIAKAIVAEHNALCELSYFVEVVIDADNDCKLDGLSRQLSDGARGHLEPKLEAVETAQDELIGKVL